MQFGKVAPAARREITRKMRVPPKLHHCRDSSFDSGRPLFQGPAAAGAPLR